MTTRQLPGSAQTILEGYLEQHFHRIQRSGREWAINCPDSTCPSHNQDGKLKLSFNVSTGIGFCFRCERPFTMIDLVRHTERVSYDRARQQVNEWTGVRTPRGGLVKAIREALQPATASEESAAPPLVDLPDEYRPVTKRRCPKYVLTRMSLKDALRYRVGYCLKGYYANRMIVPVHMADGVRGFIARLMVERPLIRKKVVYPKGMKTGLALYNYPRASRRKDVVLVEGVLDAIRGGAHYMALFGTHMTRDQRRLLRDMRPRDVVVMLDRDMQMKAVKLALRLKSYYPWWSVRVACLPAGKDPNDLRRSTLAVFAAQASPPGVLGLLGPEP